MFIDANALTYFILKRDLVNQFYFSSDLNNLGREYFYTFAHQSTEVNFLHVWETLETLGRTHAVNNYTWTKPSTLWHGDTFLTRLSL